MQLDLLIRGGACVTPAGLVEADIGVRDGRIVEIGAMGNAVADDVLDATGLTVLPGVIDSQVHFREPGLEQKEDLETGTRGAALGGVTSVFEMPNTKPPTVSQGAFGDKLRRAKGRAWCDHAFFIGATPTNYGELPELELLPGCAGVKMFMGSSTGDLLVAKTQDVLRTLQHGSRRVSVHSEDEERLRERWGLVENGADVSQHPVWRDVEAAVKNTRRLIELARQAGRRVHVLHITTAEEMAFLARHKDVATVEATPQHLTFSAPECYERLGSMAQMNPPIRDERHRQALWRALEQGVVDVLGSDHAPHTREEKEKPYPQSPSGMTGVQTLLPIMLDHVNAGRLRLERLVDLTAGSQQRVFSIARKGRIVVGYDADFAVVDLKAKRTITHDWIASRSGWTPYDGREVTGWPIHTIVRGRSVVRDGEIQGEPIGEPVVFENALPLEA